MRLSSDQIRGARAMLGWTIETMADNADLTPSTILDLEHGKGNPLERTLRKVELAVNRAGMEFVDGGVRPLQNRVLTLQGQQGYWDFYDDVYETVKNVGGEVLVSNVNERDFDKWLGERWHVHKERMAKLLKTQPFNLKILIKEGDSHFVVPGHAEYRWTPKERFSEIPFYVYGQKLAIILFETNNVSIHIIDNAKITEAYKKQFNVIWEQAILIPKELIKEHEPD